MIRRQYWLILRVSSFIRHGSRVVQCFCFLDRSLHVVVGQPHTSNYRLQGFLATLISDSNTPPKCDPSGGFQLHLIPSLAVLSAVCSRSIGRTSSVSSLFTPTRFVPLSLVTSSSLPLVATIRPNFQEICGAQ